MSEMNLKNILLLCVDLVGWIFHHPLSLLCPPNIRNMTLPSTMRIIMVTLATLLSFVASSEVRDNERGFVGVDSDGNLIIDPAVSKTVVIAGLDVASLVQLQSDVSVLQTTIQQLQVASSIQANQWSSTQLAQNSTNAQFLATISAQASSLSAQSTNLSIQSSSVYAQGSTLSSQTSSLASHASALSTHDSKILSQSTIIASQQNTIASLSALVTSVSSSTSSLSMTSVAQQTTITASISNITSLQSTGRALQTSVTSVQTSLSSVQSSIMMGQASTGAVSGLVASVSSTVAGQEALASTNIVQLQSKDTSFSTTLAGVQTSQANTQTSLASLSATVAAKPNSPYIGVCHYTGTTIMGSTTYSCSQASGTSACSSSKCICNSGTQITFSIGSTDWLVFCSA